MKTNKQILIVCGIIALVSFAGIWVLHEGIDIRLQEVITNTKWIYDSDERAFYQGLWSNVFTGAIISVFTTCVTYNRAKHDTEFGLQSSEEMLLMHFSSLASPMYMVNLKHPKNDHAAIVRFADTISNSKAQYDRMIQFSNDYCPFIKTKKAKTLMEAKNFLQTIWIEICPVEDSLLVQTEEAEIKKTIDIVRSKVRKQKTDIDNLNHTVWRL